MVTYIVQHLLCVPNFIKEELLNQIENKIKANIKTKSNFGYWEFN